MKTLTTIIATAILAFGMQACSQKSTNTYTSSGIFGGKTVKASNKYVTKDIRVSNFTGLNVAGSPSVIYTQKAGKPQVEVYTSDNIVDLLDIYVKDGTLHVGFKKGTSVSYNKLEVRVSSETLNSIAVAGSGDIDILKGLKTERLHIKVAGSGDINMDNISCAGKLDISIAGSGDISGNNISCTELKTSIAGSGDMKLTKIASTSADASIAGSGTVQLDGITEDAQFHISGSGDLFASELQAKNVSASVSGSGEIKCYATDFLKARTSGSGNIGYKGNPELDYPKKGLYQIK